MTKIEWTDRTWNPLRGCSHISPGCTNCYAATMAHRFSSPDQPYEGLTRMTPQGARWNGQIKLVPEVLEEPLLGGVDLTDYLWEIVGSGGEPDAEPRADGIDWIITGGESGPKARPMHPDWVRSIRDQCTSAGVPFFFKQWGEYLPEDQHPAPLDNPWGGEAGHASGQFSTWAKVGKKLSGHLLDGQEWRQWPEVAGKGKMA